MTDDRRVALLVASGGGHLSELLQLRNRMAGFDDYVWVVPDSPQSRSTLEGETIVFMPDVGPRSMRASLRLLGPARRLIRQIRPDAVVSTGAAPAVPFLVEAARQKVPAHFIESLTRLSEPSLSGSVLAKIPGITCHTQHPKVHWPGWYTVGSPVDVYRCVPLDEPAQIERVVVTLGTLRGYGFRSLLERLIGLLPAEADVLWQTGVTDVRGLDIAARDFLPTGELVDAIDKADLVIGHAGVGTALYAFGAGKMPLLVPRRAHRGEHVDDHQVEIAGWLARSGLAVAVELDSLAPGHLERASSRQLITVGTLPALRLHGSALEAG